MTGVNDTAIEVSGISKTFKLPHERQGSVKNAVINMFTKGQKSFERQQVLNDVSFQVKKGEFFGIVGRNGSGKSTMLKLLAGIYAPDSGDVRINGSLTPFIELGVGFNPELTGRDNVYLNGALLGFNRSEMDDMYDDIVSFAELKKFMDQKLKNYSSGMQVRLAFSIAIRARSDILLLDEVLAVGDEAFQKKCIEVFENYKTSKKTIVLVTHDMAVVERFCDRAIMMSEGKIIESGNPRKVAAAYSNQNLDAMSKDKVKNQTQASVETDIRLSIHDASGKKTNKFVEGSKMTVKMSWKNPAVRHAGLAITRTSGEVIYGPNTFTDGQPNLAGSSLEYSVDMNLLPGKYYLQAATYGANDSDVISRINEGPSIVVLKNDKLASYVGLTRLNHSWSINE
jgi:ABC-type polysaccharide/polyol phosphate transport system ATPase subunit